MKAPPDLFAASKPERREFLKSRGYKPSVGMTALTRIPHWQSSDGRIFTEVEAARRETGERLSWAEV